MKYFDFNQNQESEWDLFLECPISPKCKIYLTTRGVVTEAGIDRLIEYLKLIKPSFGERADRLKRKEITTMAELARTMDVEEGEV